MKSSDKLEEFMAEIDAVDSMEELAAKTLSVIGNYQLEAVASGLVTGSTAAARNFHFVIWPDALLARYIAEDFQAIDPGPRWARSTGIPATWKQIIYRLGTKDPGNKVIQTAAEFQLTEGLCVPMRTAEGAIGLISMGGNRPAMNAQEFRALVSIATVSFRAAERINHSFIHAQAAPILTTRQIELLPFLVHGHSDLEIASLNGIS